MKDGTPTILYNKETRGSNQCYSLLSLIDTSNSLTPTHGSTELLL
jgi:hypothetical protein